MAALRHLPILHFAFALALATASSHALQLGETEAQITARHGAAAVEDHGRRLAVYFWEGWSAQIEFKDGVVGKLTYRSNTYLTESGIRSLLQANGGVDRWRQTTSLGTKAHRWMRDDGAAATGNAARPTGLTFQAAGAVEAITPAEAILSDSFLKFDAQASMPAPQPVSATPPSEPTVRSNAPQPLPRTEPEPRTAEVAEAAITPELPPAAGSEPAVAEPVAALLEGPVSQAGSSPVVASVLLGLGLIAGMLCYLFSRRKPTRPTAFVPAAASPPAMPAAHRDDEPTLDSLRGDQIELVLGEIFRRQGFTVELSSALGANGGSDLMLRRDGESIPVQSTDWKTAHISEQEIREFYGIMASTAAPRGIFVTTGSFSLDAQEFAADKSIGLLDRAALDQCMAAVRRPDENFFDVPSWIEDFTAHARIFDPECPCCSQAMAIRRNRSDGSDSWVCSTYPRCAGKREPRRDLLTVPAAA